MELHAQTSILDCLLGCFVHILVPATLSNNIRLDLRRLEQSEQRLNEALPLLPFAPAIFELVDNRVRVEPPDSAKIAATLFRLEKELLVCGKRSLRGKGRRRRRRRIGRRGSRGILSGR